MKLKSLAFMIPAVSFCLLRPAFAVEYLGNEFKDPFHHRDPMASAPARSVKSAETAPKNNPLVIQGLVWNLKDPQAIINGKVVKIGDTLEDAQILDITKEGVKIRRQGREVFLSKKRKG